MLYIFYKVKPIAKTANTINGAGIFFVATSTMVKSIIRILSNINPLFA